MSLKRKERNEVLRSFNITASVITELIKGSIVREGDLSSKGIPEYQDMGTPFSEVKYQYYNGNKRYFGYDVVVSDEPLSMSAKNIEGRMILSNLKGRTTTLIKEFKEIISSFNKAFFLKHNKHKTKRWFCCDERIENYLNDLLESGKTVSATNMKTLCTEYLESVVDSYPDKIYEDSSLISSTYFKNHYLKNMIETYFDKSLFSRKLVFTSHHDNPKNLIDKIIDTNYLKKNRPLTKIISETCYFKRHDKSVNIFLDFINHNFFSETMNDESLDKTLNDSYKEVFKSHYITLPMVDDNNESEINISIKNIISYDCEDKNKIKGSMSKNIVKLYKMFTTPVLLREYSLIIPIKTENDSYKLNYVDAMCNETLMKNILSKDIFEEEVNRLLDEKDDGFLERSSFLTDFLRHTEVSLKSLNKDLIPDNNILQHNLEKLNESCKYSDLLNKMVELYKESWRIHTISNDDIYTMCDFDSALDTLRLKGRIKGTPLFDFNSASEECCDSDVKDESCENNDDVNPEVEPVEEVNKDLEIEEETKSIYNTIEKEEVIDNKEETCEDINTHKHCDNGCDCTTEDLKDMNIMKFLRVIIPLIASVVSFALYHDCDPKYRIIFMFLSIAFIFLSFIGNALNE